MTKCLLAGVVSHIDGAPNLALAAELEAWAAADPRPDRVCDRGKWGVGERLKAYRGMHGWSQAEAARRYGTTQCVWSAWELGARLPAPQNLARLVKHGAIDRQLAVAVLEGSGYHPNLPQAKLAHRGILPDVCDITHTPPPDPGPKKRAKKREPNPATRPNGMGD